VSVLPNFYLIFDWFLTVFFVFDCFVLVSFA